MKWFFKRSNSETQPQNANSSGRVVRLRRFGFRHFSLPRPRVANERARAQGGLPPPAE
jgi:hypothetical protein